MIDDFAALDIRVGTIKEAGFFEEAKVPAVKLKIDFGPAIGMKSLSAQITKRYKVEEIIGIVNFPPRRLRDSNRSEIQFGKTKKRVGGIYNE